MHQFSVCALFKNESHILREWLEHYIYHGADHFYLLNDESDDSYLSVLEKYISNRTVTLIDVNCERYPNRQRDIYNKYMLPRLDETKWLLLCDLDEFVWSPSHVNITKLLENCNHLAEIQVVQTLFGSNGHITQPESVVKSFTMRRNCQFGSTRTHGYKYFLNSSYPFTELNVHYAIPKDPYDEKNRWLILNDEYLILNHYSCQSKEWFEKKCKRTDANEFKSLTMSDFSEFDINEVEDTRLCQQNYPIKSMPL